MNILKNVIIAVLLSNHIYPSRYTHFIIVFKGKCMYVLNVLALSAKGIDITRKYKCHVSPIS